MASDGSDQDARYALSKLLQRGTVAEYESGFLMLIKRVKGILESLLKSFYISGLKPALQCALLRSNLTTLSEAFSLARATEARFAEDALFKLLQIGTVAEYQNEFEMLIKRVMGISKSLLKLFSISGLKPVLQIELLRSRPTSLEEAYSLTRIIEARFEDEQSTTTIAKTNDLNIELPVQDLEATIHHKPNKKDDAKPPISADTFSSNGGNDSETTGPEAPVNEVVDNGIESEVVVSLSGKFQEGDMVDALFRVEQKREAFSIARIMKAHFKTVAGKKLNIKEKIDIILSWPSEEALLVIKGSLNANEDISVVEVSSAIDDVFDIGESNVESMEVHSEFSEFSENKESVEEVVVGGGEACGVGEDELDRVIPALKDGGGEIDGRLDEINLNLSEELADNGVSPIPTSFMAHQSQRVRQLWERIGIGNDHGLMDNGRKHKFVQPNVWGWMSDFQSAYSSYHLEGKVTFEGVVSVTAWVAEGGRMVLCYVQGSGRRKRKKGVGCGSGRQENYGSGRRDYNRIRIWDPGIKRVFQDNTLRTRWFRRSGE
ncbi:hypothetical protein Tco_0299564 [Tanacetum coccineum]